MLRAGHVLVHPHRSGARCGDRAARCCRYALRSCPRGRRAAAAAPPRRRICRPRLDRRVAAIVGGERRRDPRPADRRDRPARARRRRARPQRQAQAHSGSRRRKSARSRRSPRRSKPATSISARSAACRPTMRTRSSPPFTASGHGPPTSTFCSVSDTPMHGRRATSLCRKRPGSCLSWSAGRPPRRWRRSPKRGAPGARSPRVCCGPTIGRASSATVCWWQRRARRPHGRRDPAPKRPASRQRR